MHLLEYSNQYPSCSWIFDIGYSAIDSAINTTTRVYLDFYRRSQWYSRGKFLPHIYRQEGSPVLDLKELLR